MPRPESPPGVPFLVFDFDSTLVAVESLDELFAQVMAGAGGTDSTLEARFRALTESGMDGARSQVHTLRDRLALFPAGRPNREDLVRAAEALRVSISPSVVRNRAFLVRHAGRILVVSGGFVELIAPVVAELGIPEDRVLAHRFRDTPGGGLGLDPDTPMARGGKVGALRALDGWGRPAAPPAGIREEVWVVGDGATDLELREAGLAHRFVHFTEHVHRPHLAAAADHVVSTFDALRELFR
jgi:D-3-phosphoglycerate dehydrogenase / 2-oxoglutarate reductase